MADLFTMELGNLAPGERVRITLSYVTEAEELKSLNERYYYSV